MALATSSRNPFKWGAAFWQSVLLLATGSGNSGCVRVDKLGSATLRPASQTPDSIPTFIWEWNFLILVSCSPNESDNFWPAILQLSKPSFLLESPHTADSLHQGLVASSLSSRLSPYLHLGMELFDISFLQSE